MSLFQNLPGHQIAFSYPTALVEKYRPRQFSDFLGIEKPKKIMAKFAECPKSDAFLFVGPAGIGKTTMALAFCERIGGELHHVPSQTCNVETLESVIRACHNVPCRGLDSFHCVIVDEADRMSKAAQLHLLSKLDCTAFPPNTVFIFTANSVEGLEDRFISRCKQIAFQSHGLAEQTAQFLEQVWTREVGETAEKPNFMRIVRDSQNNVRNALNMLETEILAA